MTLSIPECTIETIKSGGQKFLRSHGMTFVNDPGPPVSMLPRDVEDVASFQAVMVGAMTDAQKVEVAKRYRVNKDKIHNLFNWYKQFNTIYHDQEFDASKLPTDVMWPVDDRTSTKSDTIDVELDHHTLTSGTNPNDGNISMREYNSVVVHNLIEGEEDDKVRQHLIGSAKTTSVEVLKTCELGVGSRLTEPVVVVRKSNIFHKNSDRGIFARAFPELFPYGRGGPDDEDRQVKVSVQECCRHYLNLSSRRFAEHRIFLLYAFDLVARQHSLQALNVRCHINPSEGRDAAVIHRDDVIAYLDERAKQREAARNGEQMTGRKIHGDRYVNRVFTTLDFACSKMWSHNQERFLVRKHAFALCETFGQPTIFLTLNPDDVGSCYVQHYCGNGTLEEFIRHMGNHPSKDHSAVSNNAHATAKFFDTLVNNFIEGILGFDAKDPHKQGLFGPCVAYLGAVETQGRGSLHLHTLIWVGGFPKITEDFKRRCLDKEFISKLSEYARDITMKADFPIKIPVDTCPKCKSGNARLIVLDISVDYQFQSLKTGNKSPPSVAKCTMCKSVFTSLDLQDAAIQSRKSYFPNDNFHDKVAFGMIPQCIEDSDIGDVHLAELLRKCQTHDWRHMPTCMKKSSTQPRKEKEKWGRPCRARMPRDRVLGNTLYDPETGSFYIHRPVGCEYLNTFIKVIMRWFKCNQDVRILSGAQGSECVYYVIKYCTKEQGEIENPGVLMLNAFDKRVRRELDQDLRGIGLSDDQATKGKKRLLSMLYSITDQQQISAQLCALYFIHSTCPEYVSHEFVNLLLKQGMAVIAGKPYYGNAEPTQEAREKVVVPQILDYWYRPIHLESLCYREFVSQYNKVINMRAKRECESDVDSFLEEHPQHLTHKIAKRGRVAVVMTTRLPDREKLKTRDDEIEYAVMVMLQFQPHRHFSEVVPQHLDAKHVFDTWIVSDTAVRARDYCDNCQDYYVGKALAKEMQGKFAQDLQARVDEVGSISGMDSDSDTADRFRG